MGSGRMRDAQKLLERALRRFPGDVSLWLNLPAALLSLDGALRADPRNFLALLMRAHILEAQGQTRQAARDIQRELAGARA